MVHLYDKSDLYDIAMGGIERWKTTKNILRCDQVI